MRAAELKARQMLAEGRVTVMHADGDSSTVRVLGSTDTYTVQFRHGEWACPCACFGLKCSHIAAARIATTKTPTVPMNVQVMA